jgi:hypothetical protein
MTKDIIFSQRNLNAILIDRKPCALATLTGTAGDDVRCNVSLYQTPLGVLVKADIDGLPHAKKTSYYRIAFESKHRTFALPCTHGGCRILTADFSAGDVLGHTVCLLSDTEDKTLAKGRLAVGS